jgi:hypothetical protein
VSLRGYVQKCQTGQILLSARNAGAKIPVLSSRGMRYPFMLVMSADACLR